MVKRFMDSGNANKDLLVGLVVSLVITLGMAGLATFLSPPAQAQPWSCIFGIMCQ